MDNSKEKDNETILASGEVKAKITNKRRKIPGARFRKEVK